MSRQNRDHQPPDERWDSFLELLDKQKFGAARTMCRMESEKDPDSVRWTLGLAWCHLGTGRLASGLKLAQKAAERNPRSGLAFRTIASIYIRLDDLDAAIDAANHAMHLESDRTARALVKNIRRRIQERDAALARSKSNIEPEFPAAEANVVDLGSSSTSPFTQVIDDPSSFHHLVAEAGSFDAAEHTVAARLMNTVPPDAQLASLYGQSLFGGWDESVAAGLDGLNHSRLMPSLNWKHIVAIPVVLTILGIAYGAVHAVLDRDAVQQRQRIALRLHQLIRIGAVEQLAEHLSDPEVDHAEFNEAGGTHHALWLRGQATVYRYLDADPTRADIFRQSNDRPAADRWEAVTRALVVSRAERPAARKTLVLPDGVKENDPQAAFLQATIFRRAGDSGAARGSLEVALALEPSNLVHLAEQLEIYAWNRWRRKTDELIAEMHDIRPHACWTRVAEARSSIWMRRPAPPEPVILEGVDAPPDPIGVPAAELAMIRALASLRSGDTNAAQAALTEAMRHVNHQPPFLLDFVDDALKAGRPAIARVIMGSPGWPRATPSARAAEGRVLAAEGGQRAALIELVGAWKAGCRDPRAADTLLGLIATSKAAGIHASAVLSDLILLWPERLEYQIRLASALMAEGQPAEAALRLRGRMDAVDKTGSKRLRSQAYLILARVEASEGKNEEALRLATRAAKFDRNNSEASELAKSLVDSRATADDRSGGSQQKKKKKKRGKKSRR